MWKTQIGTWWPPAQVGLGLGWLLAGVPHPRPIRPLGVSTGTRHVPARQWQWCTGSPITHCLNAYFFAYAGSISAAVSADSVEEEVFENERFARGGALSGQVRFASCGLSQTAVA